MDPGFPRIIGESWNGIPDDVDSAFSLNDIGKYFLFLPAKFGLISMSRVRPRVALQCFQLKMQLLCHLCI